MSSRGDPQKTADAAMAAYNVVAKNPEAIQAGSQAVEQVQGGVQKAGGCKVVAGAAAVGGLAGAALVGGVVVPAAAAAGAAVCAMRSDGIGDAARATGNAAVRGVERAKDFSKEHQIPEKVNSIVTGAVVKAKEVNEKYHVVDNAKAGAAAAAAKAAEINEKYKVSEKVSKGFISGLNKLADALDPKDKKAVTDK